MYCRFTRKKVLTRVCDILPSTYRGNEHWLPPPPARTLDTHSGRWANFASLVVSSPSCHGYVVERGSRCIHVRAIWTLVLFHIVRKFLLDPRKVHVVMRVADWFSHHGRGVRSSKQVVAQRGVVESRVRIHHGYSF